MIILFHFLVPCICVLRSTVYENKYAILLSPIRKIKWKRISLLKYYNPIETIFKVLFFFFCSGDAKEIL